MERKLLLLGLLRMHEMYGYQLNEVIDHHLETSVHLTKPAVYDLLKRMADEGWITHKEEREGKRPPRRVYSITSQGEVAFQEMLRESLADYKPAEFRSDISLAFMDVLPPGEVTPLLKKRRSAIEDRMQKVSSHAQHPGSFQLVIEHQLRHLSIELEWLDEVIKRIRSG